MGRNLEPTSARQARVVAYPSDFSAFCQCSVFSAKKPQDAPAAEAPKTQHYSAEELAAAFPSAAPVEDKEPAPAAVAAEPAPVESPPQPSFQSLSNPPR